MLKVLLVDDDFQVLKRLENLIDWKAKGLEYIGFAQDGNSAFKIISEKRPDIVFTDIVMPGMNGIELIRKVYESGMNPRFIVLSFYTEHTYIRETMKLGALEYLIKDEINNGVLNEAIEYAKGIIKKQTAEIEINKRDREIAEKNNDILRQEAVKNLLSGSYKDSGEAEDFFASNKNSYPYKSFVIACIELDRLPEEETEKSTMPQKLQLALQKTREMLNENVSAIVSKTSDTAFVCLLGFAGMNSEMLRINTLLTQFNNIIKHLSVEYNIWISVGVSGLCNNFIEIPAFYQKGLAALKMKRFFRPGQVIFSEHFTDIDIQKRENDVTNLIVKIHEIVNNKMDFLEIRGLVKEISGFFKPGVIGADEAAHFIMEIMLAYSLILRRMTGSIGVLQIGETASGTIKYGDFFADFFRLLDLRLEKCQAKMAGLALNNELRWEIREVIDFLKNNYDKKISLEQVAEKIGMSKAYISKLFKKEMGINLEDYLLEYRIKIAVELLKTSNLKLYEIAIELGFCSTQHFSKTFKKYQGVTPEAFKRNPQVKG